jgi:hypothetical protein
MTDRFHLSAAIRNVPVTESRKRLPEVRYQQAQVDCEAGTINHSLEFFGDDWLCVVIRAVTLFWPKPSVGWSWVAIEKGLIDGAYGTMVVNR